MTPEQEFRDYYLRELRAERAAASKMIDAISLDDPFKFWEAFSWAVSNSALPGALRTVVRIGQPANDRVRTAFMQAWLQHGSSIRQEAGSDLVLIAAMRLLMPPYRGPDMTLYRGEGFANRRRRTYGLAWTTYRDVAEHHATRDWWRSSAGGSVLLKACVPAAAVICAPCELDDRFGEREFLVDRRAVGKVSVIRRFSRSTSR